MCSSDLIFVSWIFKLIGLFFHSLGLLYHRFIGEFCCHLKKKKKSVFELIDEINPSEIYLFSHY